MSKLFQITRTFPYLPLKKGWRRGFLFLLLMGCLALFASGCAREEVRPTTTQSTQANTAPTAAQAAPVPTALPASTTTTVPSRTLSPSPIALPTPTPTPKPAILIGAGDISYCGKDYLGDDQTAQLMTRLLQQFPEAQIFTAGDNVQGDGFAWEFRDCFNPTWGQFKQRIHPVPGNHDYMTEQGAPYYAYFGTAAGSPGLGYYSYNLGGWHIVALNSNCNDIACGANSQQAQWLRADLSRNPSRCTLLYWHYPRWSSGLAGSRAAVSAFWNIAYEMGAELVISGDDHDYERFAPQDASGKADPNGVRQFVAGTGGAPEREWGTPQPNSEVRNNKTWGVLKLSLFPDHYEWEFVPVDGGAFHDSGRGECH